MRRQIVLVTVLVVVAFQATVPGQTPSKEVAPRQIVSPRLPDTPAGRQLAGWLQAFNSGDAETLRKYLSANLSSDAVRATSVADRVERNLFVYEDTGGLIISDVVTSSPQQIAVIARMKKKERRVRVMLEVTDSNPRAIASIGIRLLPSRPSSNARQGKLSESEIASGLADFLNKEAAADRFSGAALVAKNGQPILERAYGLADRPAHRPNRLDTRFNLGSMNKMFTGVAIMQLVEQGKLSLQDTIDKCLPDYPDKEIARQVTVHQLLTHTSGLGDFFNEKFRTASHRPEKLADFVPYFAGQPLGFPPGTKFRYSNAGYIVLGLIVEKISGTNYYDYVKQHIYEPAGMVNTAHRYPPSEKTTVAVGYTHAEALGARSAHPGRRGPSRASVSSKRVEAEPLGLGSSAGGGYSTVHDMLCFARALHDHRFLSAKSTELMTTAVGLKGSAFAYGYGFGNEAINGHRAFGHNGGAPGVGAHFECYPDLGYTLIVLSNYDAPDMDPVVDMARQLIAR